jgi:hypothetical protein
MRQTAVYIARLPKPWGLVFRENLRLFTGNFKMAGFSSKDKNEKPAFLM